MDVESVFHMKEGLGETSYAQNSSIQKNVTELIKHVLVESAIDAYASKTPEESFTVADLGCASGTNSLSLLGEVIKAIHERARQLGRAPPEFLVFLNDLPCNDFNTLFLSFPGFTKKLEAGVELQGGSAPSVSLAGVPGSFYGRLFPSNNIDFIYSCQSLHWLSQVPPGLVDDGGKPLNKAKMYISDASTPAVLSAYLKQFQKDFSLFLKSRSSELHFGGRMVISMSGRKTKDHSDKNSTVSWELLNQALAILVSQEMIDEEEVGNYNVPFYAPSVEEIEDEVHREGSFTIDYVQISEMNTSTGDLEKDAKIMSMAIRAVQGSLISHHFGEEILDPLFQIYSGLISEFMVKEDMRIDILLMVLRKTC